MLHLRVTPNKDEIKLYHIEGFVISIAFYTSSLPRLLKGEFTEDLYGIKVNSPEEEVKYVTARFKNNKDGELEVTYCCSPDLAESFTNKVIPFGNVSKDRSSVTTKDGDVLKPFNTRETLSNLLLDLEDGESRTHHLLYRTKDVLDFKVLYTDIVRNNSILTINNYFGKLITCIHVEDLLRDNEESSIENGSEYSLSGVCPTGPDLYVSFDALRKYNFLSSKKYGFNLIVELGISINSQTRGQVRGRILPEGRPMSTNVLITFEVCPDGQICAFIYRENNHTFFPHQTTVHRLFFEEHKDSKVKADEYVKEIPEMTEVKDPTKVMMTAEEARGLSDANLFNIFTQLNDKVTNAIDEGKRYIVIEPNTTIPAEVRDTVLKTLREDLGYNVGVSVSGEISISW